MEIIEKITVQKGKQVIIDYQVRLATGQLVDSAEKTGGPVSFVCGAGEFLQPVEEKIIGLETGESIAVIVPPVYTYGYYDNKKVILIARERINGEISKGKPIKAPDEFGIQKQGFVVSEWQGALLIDFNHPLAGKHLNFFVKILEIKEPENK